MWYKKLIFGINHVYLFTLANKNQYKWRFLKEYSKRKLDRGIENREIHEIETKNILNKLNTKRLVKKRQLEKLRGHYWMI